MGKHHSEANRKDSHSSAVRQNSSSQNCKSETSKAEKPQDQQR